MRGRLIRWTLPLVVAAVAGFGAALAATASTGVHGGTVKTAKSADFGAVLVSSSGRTLYRYTLDRKRVNTCTKVAICAKYWPRLLVKAGAKPTAGTGVKASLLGTIPASGTMRQVTYAGWPLYLFAGDRKAGQTKGQGFNKQWYVVNAKGALVKHAAMTTPAPSSSYPQPVPAPTTTAAGGGWG